MNVYGHQLAIKYLKRHEEFWEEISEQAFGKGLRTEMRVCQNFAEGERKKIAWHRGKINFLKAPKR